MRDDERNNHFRKVAEHLSTQPEKFDKDFWKGYFQWAWRGVFFAVLLAFAANYNYRKGILGSIEHISALQWAFVLVLGLLAPALFVGWSYLWMWGQDLIGRFRR